MKIKVLEFDNSTKLEEALNILLINNDIINIVLQTTTINKNLDYIAIVIMKEKSNMLKESA